MQVWNIEDFFHSILESFHIPYRFFPYIPYHSMPCIMQRHLHNCSLLSFLCHLYILLLICSMFLTYYNSLFYLKLV